MTSTLCMVQFVSSYIMDLLLYLRTTFTQGCLWASALADVSANLHSNDVSCHASWFAFVLIKACQYDHRKNCMNLNNDPQQTEKFPICDGFNCTTQYTQESKFTK